MASSANSAGIRTSRIGLHTYERAHRHRDTDSPQQRENPSCALYGKMGIFLISFNDSLCGVLVQLLNGSILTLQVELLITF